MREACSRRCFPRPNPASWPASFWELDGLSERPWRLSWWQAISPALTGDLLKGIRTMTANIVLEMGYATDLHREALIATGVVLFVFILIINLLFSIVKNKGERS